MTPPLIALEEHYYSPAILDSFENSLKAGIKAWPGAMERLMDAGDFRLEEMDKGKVSLQVISHCAADRPPPDACRAGNDSLAQAIQKSTVTRMRFAGFAVLPMNHPEAAMAEFERTVKELGFVGALIDNKAGNRFYDGEEYMPFWEKAQELDVPVYLHPSWPSEELFQQSYAGNYAPRAMSVLGGAQWGWHSEVGLHVLRLHAAGVFDKFPKLKIVLGHFGEMMPYMLQRIQDQELLKGRRDRTFLQVWDENIWITTSACWSLDPMRCILANTKIDRIMYSIDYPFTTNEQGLKFMEDLENSGLVTQDQLDKIAYKNAEALLGVKAPTELHMSGPA
jgi:predicted TIM-barrel fold metal-dependent hydrolase